MAYVFPHVPKCGGTSMLRHLEKSGLRVHLDYSVWLDPRQLADRDFAAEFDIIFGHFPITRYLGPGYRYIALARDPMERCLSSYKFHHRYGVENPQDNDLYSRMGRWIDRGELSFREYVRMGPDMRSVYKYFLDYWPRERFELIGTTHRFGAFLADLSRLLNIPEIKNDVHERQSAELVDISDVDRQRIQALLADEYNWFYSLILPSSEANTPPEPALRSPDDNL
jgi:hypothetical protein